MKRHVISNIDNNSNICILSILIGKEYGNECSYGTLSKDFYCYKNKYDFIIGREKDYSKITHNKKRYGWLKVYKLLEILNNYDYIFVSDADVSIMNHNLKLESITNRFMDDDTLMLITKDHNNINSGNFIVKDLTSGSNDQISRYGYLNNISNKHGKKPPSETSFAASTTFISLSVKIKSLIFLFFFKLIGGT